MWTVFKAEIRKLMTVRSTLFILVFASLFTVFVTYQMEHFFKTNPEMSVSSITAVMQNIISLPALAGSVIVALLVMHEYRYNTITYALVSTRRIVFFLSKIFAGIVMLLVTYVVGSASILLGSWLGARGSGINLFANTDVMHLVGTTMFFVVAFGLAAILIAFLVRNVVGAFSLIFLLPGTIEPLLGLALKSNTVYLPFTVLGRVVGQSPAVANPKVLFSPGEAALLFSAYLVVFGAITCVLFLRRDAN